MQTSVEFQPYSRPIRQKNSHAIRAFHRHLPSRDSPYHSNLPVYEDDHNGQYLKSITILDGVSVAPVSDNIEVHGGVSCCP